MVTFRHPPNSQFPVPLRYYPWGFVAGSGPITSISTRGNWAWVKCNINPAQDIGSVATIHDPHPRAERDNLHPGLILSDRWCDLRPSAALATCRRSVADGALACTAVQGGWGGRGRSRNYAYLPGTCHLPALPSAFRGL